MTAISRVIRLSRGDRRSATATFSGGVPAQFAQGLLPNRTVRRYELSTLAQATFDKSDNREPKLHKHVRVVSKLR